MWTTFTTVASGNKTSVSKSHLSLIKGFSFSCSIAHTCLVSAQRPVGPTARRPNTQFKNTPGWSEDIKWAAMRHISILHHTSALASVPHLKVTVIVSREAFISRSLFHLTLNLDHSQFESIANRKYQLPHQWLFAICISCNLQFESIANRKYQLTRQLLLSICDWFKLRMI